MTMNTSFTEGMIPPNDKYENTFGEPVGKKELRRYYAGMALQGILASDVPARIEAQYGADNNEKGAPE
jgi:hypothetical protein